MTREILWAVDFSLEDLDSQKSILPLAKKFAFLWDCQVRPVFVLNNKILKMDIDIYMRLEDTDWDGLESAIFQDFYGAEDDAALEDGTLILSNTYTRRGLVRSLLEYAEENNVAAIFCSTRTRSKHYPSFLGGFTETLINQSSIPIISSHPENDKEEIKTILYATELRKANDPNLEPLLAAAKSFGAKLRIFHNSSETGESLYLAPHFPQQKSYENWLQNAKKARERREKIAENLLQRAKDEGVDCELEWSTGNPVVEESILDSAKANDVDLIVMSSNSSLIEGAIFGSVVKEVLRRSKCPVWIINKNRGSF